MEEESSLASPSQSYRQNINCVHVPEAEPYIASSFIVSSQFFGMGMKILCFQYKDNEF